MKNILFIASEAYPFLLRPGIGRCGGILAKNILTRKNLMWGNDTKVYSHSGRI